MSSFLNSRFCYEENVQRRHVKVEDIFEVLEELPQHKWSANKSAMSLAIKYWLLITLHNSLLSLTNRSICKAEDFLSPAIYFAQTKNAFVSLVYFPFLSQWRHSNCLLRLSNGSMWLSVHEGSFVEKKFERFPIQAFKSRFLATHELEDSHKYCDKYFSPGLLIIQVFVEKSSHSQYRSLCNLIVAETKWRLTFSAAFDV